MSLLFESIACREGQLLNLEYHEARLNRSRASLLEADDPLDLGGIRIPAKAQLGLWKCRVSYGYEIEKVEFTPYTAQNHQIFKLVNADIAYPHKYEDRTGLDNLYALRERADEIIIVAEDMITDSSYGNLIFYDGKNWLTPATPLLPGTMRAALLEQGIIQQQKISPHDLQDFQRFMMINALNPFEEARALPIKNII